MVLDLGTVRCPRFLLLSMHINSKLRLCRWINETLYKSDSKRAVQMMSEDPKVYEDVRCPRLPRGTRNSL